MIDYTDSETARDLVSTVVKLLREWQLDDAEQVVLLGLPASTKGRALNRLALHGDHPLDDDFLQRAQLLLAIKNAVDSLFPFNNQAACLWVTTPNLFFDDITPARIMINEGLDGMERIINHLDGKQDWG